MVKQKQTKKPLRNEAEWKNIFLKRSTVKEIRKIQVNLDLATYDKAVLHILDFYNSRKWSA